MQPFIKYNKAKQRPKISNTSENTIDISLKEEKKMNV